jgi:hypothetical protein
LRTSLSYNLFRLTLFLNSLHPHPAISINTSFSEGFGLKLPVRVSGLGFLMISFSTSKQIDRHYFKLKCNLPQYFLFMSSNYHVFWRYKLLQLSVILHTNTNKFNHLLCPVSVVDANILSKSTITWIVAKEYPEMSPNCLLYGQKCTVICLSSREVSQTFKCFKIITFCGLMSGNLLDRHQPFREAFTASAKTLAAASFTRMQGIIWHYWAVLIITALMISNLAFS